MLTETQITTCSTNTSATVNVLFAGERAIPDDLLYLLDSRGYLWDRVQLSELHTSVQHRMICGTVIVDAERINIGQADAYQNLFEKLDLLDIPVILYRCPSYIKTDNLQLAVRIESGGYEELWARIDCGVQFAKRLQKLKGQKENYLLAKDTAQQLEMAGRVQRNFLPSQLPDNDTIRWATVFRPAEWVSGDIYDVARLDEEHIGFYLADAVGHSMPAALLTMFLKHSIIMRQTYGSDYTIFKPREVITALNLRMMQQELSGCLFATCFYGLLNIRTLTLEYARAGHPYPLLIRGGHIHQLESRGGLLGVFEEAQFEQKILQLQPDDKLFVYSDGGEPLIGHTTDEGQLQLKQSFLDICSLPIVPMLQAFNRMAALYEFPPNQIDDITAIGMHIVQ